MCLSTCWDTHTHTHSQKTHRHTHVPAVVLMIVSRRLLKLFRFVMKFACAEYAKREGRRGKGKRKRERQREGEMCVEAVRKGRLIALFDTFKLYFNFELPGK